MFKYSHARAIVLVLKTAVAKLQLVDVSCKYIMQYRKLYNLKHRHFFHIPFW